MKILFYDDDHELQSILHKALTKDHHEVVSLYQSVDIIQEVLEHDPGLVMMDIKIGNQKGDELIRKIKLNPSTASVPTLLVSGHVDIDRLAERCGADHFFSKPFTLSELRKFIQQIDNAGN